jgi:hypothetical protein
VRRQPFLSAHGLRSEQHGVVGEEFDEGRVVSDLRGSRCERGIRGARIIDRCGT